MTLSVVGEADNPLADFTQLLYGESEGYVYTATKQSSGVFSQRFFQWPSEVSDLHAHIISNSGYVDTYIAPALFKSFETSLKENFQSSKVVWCEFDGNAPDPDTLPNDIPVPSIRIQSSETGHEHWYWKLTEEVTDIDSIERVNRALAYHLNADSSGWDANQILRPPGSFNHKRGKPVGFTYRSDVIYKLADFQAWEAPQRITDELIDSTIPDAFDVAMRYAWPNQASELYRSRPEPGQRSSALMQLAYFCCEMSMTNVEIYSIIRNADDRWGKFKDRTDRERRLVDIISVARIKHPVGVPAEGLSPLSIMGFEELLNAEVSLTWAIEGLLQEQGGMLLTGLPGVGKTQISIRFAMALALGHDFLGFSIPEPIKILMFSLEMGLADLKYFVEIMSEGLSDEDRATLQNNLKFIPYGEALYLDKSETQKAVEALLKEHQPVGVFYDSFGSTTADELSSESTVKAITDWDARVRKEYNVFSWYIHHQRKAQAQNKKPKTLSDVYGSQYITARATSVYCVWEEQGALQLLCLKKRLSRADLPIAIERTGNLDFVRTILTDQFNDTVIGEAVDYEPSESNEGIVNGFNL